MSHKHCKSPNVTRTKVRSAGGGLTDEPQLGICVVFPAQVLKALQVTLPSSLAPHKGQMFCQYTVYLLKLRKPLETRTHSHKQD